MSQTLQQTGVKLARRASALIVWLLAPLGAADLLCFAAQQFPQQRARTTSASGTAAPIRYRIGALRIGILREDNLTECVALLEAPVTFCTQ
jgi:hypothetical protein